MKKQLVALLVLTALLLALAPMTALAAEEFTIKDGVLTKYKGTGGAVTIPAGVTEIGPQAFANSGITAVTIPEGVTTIGKEAFMNCADLAGVVIPNSVTSIGESAFLLCGRMRNLTLGSGITKIEKAAFARTGILELTIPANVTAIGESAFSNAEKLKALTLPEGLVTIGKNAFDGAKSLESVVIPNSLRNLGDEAFANCGSLKSISIPSTVSNIGVNVLTAAAAGLKVSGVPGSQAENLAKATYGAEFVAVEEAVQANIAYASTQDVLIDSTTVRLEAYALKDAAGNSTNYVKVRDVAVYLDNTPAQFNVGWDGAVNIETGKIYSSKNGQENHTPYFGNQPYHPNTAQTKVNGKVVPLDSFIIVDGNGKGSTYYKLRDLGQALNFDVDWVPGTGICIETDKPYDPAD